MLNIIFVINFHYYYYHSYYYYHFIYHKYVRAVLFAVVINNLQAFLQILWSLSVLDYHWGHTYVYVFFKGYPYQRVPLLDTPLQTKALCSCVLFGLFRHIMLLCI